MQYSPVLFIDMSFAVLGILILLPILVTTRMRYRNEYVGKLYFRMLLLCIALIFAEALTGIYMGGAEISRTVFQMTEFIFYLLLMFLCFDWIFYSYFWFNHCPAEGRTRNFFLLVLFLDTVALIQNLVTGNIYRIDSDGIYRRGIYFAVYIIFCYAFMMLSISVMAFRSMQKHRKEEKRNFFLFLLFFIFPAVGPVLQYRFYNISVMGISQAIALYQVYLVLQQRIMNRYEYESEQYREDYRKYEKVLGDLVALNKDSICFSHMNLTRNTRRDEHGDSMLLCGTTVDELFNSVISRITEKKEAEGFRAMFNRAGLIRDFEKQKQVSFSYHRRVETGESHYIRTNLCMLKNPSGGDIEAVFYSIDEDRQEKEEMVISAITDREYDYISLVSTETGKIHYQFTTPETKSSLHLKLGDYDTEIKKVLESPESEKLGVDFDRLSFRRVREELKDKAEYSVIFLYGEASGIRQKKISFRYLDEDHQEILFLRNDITEETRHDREMSERLQTALREAQHANSMKTEFLSNVSHDIRTPLNAVLGYAALAEKTEDLSAVRDYLQKIDRAGNVLLTLINDTLDISKIETGIIKLKPRPISCGEVIRRIVSSVRPDMDAKNIRFTLDNSRAVMAVINVDSLRLQEIFMNLLSNAVKFTPENGEITLVVECTEMSEHQIHDRITVRDTGCGISPEFLPKIFEPFAQERQEDFANVPGSGLGLTIVKKLLNIMGGTIEVKSELGKGSEFIVDLDLERIDIKTADPVPGPEAAAVLSGRRILIAEDNEMNTEILKTILEMKGIKVRCTENGEAACSAFAASEPGEYDAVLMDLRMPVMNGYEATKKIRGMKRADAGTVPIIALSADAFDDDVKESLDAGMNAHLAKPIDPGKLYKTISSFIK